MSTLEQGPVENTPKKKQADVLDDIGTLMETTLNILKSDQGASPGPAIPYQTLAASPGPDMASPQESDPPLVGDLLGGMPGAPLEEEVDIHGTSLPLPAPPATARMLSMAAPFEEESLADDPPSVTSAGARGGSAGLSVSSVSGPAVAEINAEVAAEPTAQQPQATAAPEETYGAEAGLMPRAVAECPIKIWVKDAEKVDTIGHLGIKTQVIYYTVRTHSEDPIMRADHMEVRRRFSEFDALHKLLHHDFRGLFLPPLPEKAYLEGKLAGDEFLRLRRADLQAFMRSLVAHPELRHAEALKVFLLQPAELARNPAWLAIVARQQAAKQQAARPALVDAPDTPSSTGTPGAAPSPGGSASGSMVGGWMSWVRQSVLQPIATAAGNATVTHKHEMDDEEVQLRQSKVLMQDLQRLLQLAADSARTLCQHMDNVCSDFHDLARNFGMLSRYEEEVQVRVGQYTPEGHSAANRAGDLQRVALCAGKQHNVWRTMGVKTAATLVTLHDYYIITPEAVKALEEREEALQTMHDLEDDLANRKRALDEATAQTQTRNGAQLQAAQRRVQLLTQQVVALEDSLRAARETYATIKTRNQRELMRLGLEREVDFKRMMQVFAVTQAGLVQASADLWSSLARQFSE